MTKVDRAWSGIVTEFN